MFNSLLFLIMPAMSSGSSVADDDFPVPALNTRQRASIISELDSPNALVRLRAASRIGEEKLKNAIPHLISRLNDSNPTVRAEVIKSLGILKVKTVANKVYKYLLHDPSPLVRARSATALGKMKFYQAVPAIIPLLDRPDIRERLAAINALGRLGGPKVLKLITRNLASSNSEIREAALHALAVLKDKRAVFYLHRYIESGNMDIKRAAISALSIRDPDFLKGRVKNLLNIQNDELQLVVLEAISLVGCPECEKKINELIKTGNDRISCKAASVAAYLNITSSIDDILYRLRMNPTVAAKMGYLWACSRLGALQCINDGLQFLSSPTSEQKLLGLKALRILRAARADLKSHVLHLLHDHDNSVLAEAVNFLSEYGDRRFVDTSGIINSRSPEIISSLARSLRWITPAEKEILRKVTGWLSSDDNKIRAAGALAAGISGDIKYSGKLLSLIYSQDLKLKKEVVISTILLKTQYSSGAYNYLVNREQDSELIALALLGLSMLNWNKNVEIKLITHLNRSLKKRDEITEFICSFALLNSEKTEHINNFNKIFSRIFFSGFNSSKKLYLMNLLKIADVKKSREWFQKLADSPLHRVKIHAYRFLARFNEENSKVVQKTKPAVNKNPGISSERTMLQLPFKSKQNENDGCACLAGKSATDSSKKSAGILILFFAVSLIFIRKKYENVIRKY
ncbi:MAG: HEAT repeat domain-containing protein [Deltaproteobacteria bacterium]|nr:HEAT repeat domain-containing protein [Deltaproteobacteria bacterium]